MRLEEMTSREVSGGGIIERLTMQLKLTKATLKSVSEVTQKILKSWKRKTKD